MLRGRAGRTTIEQAGVETTRDEPFIDVLREPDGGVRRAVRAGSAAIHRWRRRLLRLRRGRVVRAGGAPPEAAGRSRSGRLHDVRHRPGVRPRQAPHPGDRQRAAAAGRGSRAVSTTSRARRSTSSSASSSAICRGPSGGRPRASRSRPTRRARPSKTRSSAIQEDIAAGEVFQAVISQRFDTSTDASPFDVYRALRHINPSPYMFFMRMGQDAIIGASPEMLVRVEGRHVETHPIAGTRRRGDDAGRRSAAGRRAPAQREGARRARHARGPGPQRHRPRARRSAACACRSSWRSSATRT